jgi:hypothetical protein
VSIEKIKVDRRPELEEMVAKELNQIGTDLTTICNNVPINDKATLDVLCHDNNGQLVIMQLSVCEDDAMLLHGIQSLDYVDKFKSFLKATYNKHNIDDKAKPRLVLIAPSFSDAVRHAVESMKGLNIDLYEWEYLRIGDNKGFYLQPLFTSEPRERPRQDRQAEKKNEPKHGKKKEPEPFTEPEMKEEPAPPPEPATEPPAEQFPEPEKPAEETKEEPPRRKLKLF